MSSRIEMPTLHRSASSTEEKREAKLEESDFSNISFHSLSHSSSYYAVARNAYYDEVKNLGEKPREFSLLTADDSRVQCELMLSHETPVGIFVHRKLLRERCPYDNASNTFEVELCELFNKEDPERYREKLADRVISLAKQVRAESVHIFLPEVSGTLKDQFKVNGFSIVPEKRKHHFYFPLNSIAKGFASLAREAQALSQAMEGSKALLENQDRKRKRLLEESGPSDLPVLSKPPEEKRARQDSFPSSYDRREPSHGRSQSADRVRPEFNKNGPRSHELTLRKMYIHQIRNGQKTVEGRIFSGVVLRYQPGDKIRFFYHHDPYDDVRCTIEKIERFGSFREMLEKVGYKKCLAEVYSLSEAVRVYDSIPNYKERADQHGVAAIHLKME